MPVHFKATNALLATAQEKIPLVAKAFSGPRAGKWRASDNLDANAAFSFDSVPSGKYVVSPSPAAGTPAGEDYG